MSSRSDTPQRKSTGIIRQAALGAVNSLPLVQLGRALEGRKSARRPVIEDELTRLSVELKRTVQHLPEDWTIKALQSRYLLDVPTGEPGWEDFRSGIILKGTLPILGEGEEWSDAVSKMALVGEPQQYKAREVLTELNISPKKAGKLFFDHMRRALIQLDRGVGDKTLEFAIRQAYQFERQIGREQSPRTDLEVYNPNTVVFVRQTIDVLERLLALARDYAEDLVSVLEHYLETTRNLGRRLSPARSSPMAVDKVLTKLKKEELLGYLTELPIFLYSSTSADGKIIATAAVPMFQCETLDRSYRRLWEELLLSPVVGTGNQGGALGDPIESEKALVEGPSQLGATAPRKPEHPDRRS